jgi:hypothetical protein
MNWRILSLLAFYAVTTAAGSAAAQGIAPPGSRPMVALALDVRGATEPTHEPFSEFAAGQSLTLKEGAEVEFLHYPTCEIVVVKGGDLAFSEQRYTARGGKVIDVKRSKCPKTVALDGETQIGGVVLRSIPGPQVLSLATRPGFVAAGAKRHAYKQVRVRREGQILFEGPLTGNRFEWPEGRPPLDPNGNYTLELVAASGEARSFAFRAEERRGEVPLTVVRLD